MKKSILSFVFLLIVNIHLIAQCAMCKASAETSLDAGSGEAAGINAGVLYVLVITFGVLGFIVYLFRQGINTAEKV